jgi:hypothetical protein
MNNDSQQHNGKNGTSSPLPGVHFPQKIKRFDALSPAADRDDQDAPKNAPILTVRERGILIRIIAKYENITTIQTILHEEYPDFPEVQPAMLRYYRRKIQSVFKNYVGL